MASKRLSSGGIAVGYDISRALEAAGVLPWQLRAKRLRRMPHLFCRVLELPVGAESPVQVEESTSSFTFKVLLPPPLPEQDDIRAQVIHIVPGVIKVCVAGTRMATALLDELDIPLWRFRLPASSLPEASTAACNSDGLLVLTVPKDPSSPPSLLQPHQVTLVETLPPSFDADHGPVAHIDGKHSPASDEYTNLSGFGSLSASLDQVETVDVCDPHTPVNNDESSDVHKRLNSPSPDAKRDDGCDFSMDHEDFTHVSIAVLHMDASEEIDRSKQREEHAETS